MKVIQFMGCGSAFFEQVQGNTRHAEKCFLVLNLKYYRDLG